MKMFDIHTRKETKDNSRYQKEIKSNLVKDYVLQNIDFPLTDEYWIEIDNSFAQIWNNQLGIGGYFYWDEISKQIYSDIKRKMILLDEGRVNKIANLILTYIENYGGFLE